MNRRDFLRTCAGGAVCAPLAGQAHEPRPNIIFIMADDLGYGDLGCYGQKTLRTPNIDRLAAEGVRCTDVYSGSTVCAPSRCALMTGLHMGHATVRGNRNPEVPLRPGDVTVAEVLKQAGYKTAMFGKWGVGGPVTLGRPNVQGFDEFLGYLSQWHAHEHFPAHLWQNEVELFLGPNRSGGGEIFSQDLFTERALEFLDAHSEQPFFLYLPYAVPHANNELGNRTGDGMEVPDYGEYGENDWPTPEKGFARQVQYLDRDVGRILAKLEELKLDRNTVIFLTSDNGPHQEGGHRVDFFDSNGVLRGYKRDLYEGGIRVPMIVRWPGKIEAGSTSAEPWAFWDVLPTCADLAGVPAPEGIDGLSFVPALTGKPQQGHDYLYWEFHERRFAQAVRQGKWKAVRLNPGEPIELYDLDADLSETRNVAAEHPAIVERMAAIMESARTESPYFPVKKS
ncbi:MAG: arylsulfatase [Acidobacteria bacterium]|nr:arylsulfatase [Acidobacteriota bacterium]